MGKVFNIYCNGYSKTVLTANEVQAYVDWLRGQGCVGKEVVIHVGRGDLKAAVFDLNNGPSRRDILTAA